MAVDTTERKVGHGSRATTGKTHANRFHLVPSTSLGSPLGVCVYAFFSPQGRTVSPLSASHAREISARTAQKPPRAVFRRLESWKPSLKDSSSDWIFGLIAKAGRGFPKKESELASFSPRSSSPLGLVARSSSRRLQLLLYYSSSETRSPAETTVLCS